MLCCHGNVSGAHLDDRVDIGEGWLTSETPLLGELCSLSMLSPQECSGIWLSSLNSWPVIMRSISWCEICRKQTSWKVRSLSIFLWQLTHLTNVNYTVLAQITSIHSVLDLTMYSLNTYPIQLTICDWRMSHQQLNSSHCSSHCFD